MPLCGSFMGFQDSLDSGANSRRHFNALPPLGRSFPAKGRRNSAGRRNFPAGRRNFPAAQPRCPHRVLHHDISSREGDATAKGPLGQITGPLGISSSLLPPTRDFEGQFFVFWITDQSPGYQRKAPANASGTTIERIANNTIEPKRRTAPLTPQTAAFEPKRGRKTDDQSLFVLALRSNRRRAETSHRTERPANSDCNHVHLLAAPSVSDSVWYYPVLLGPDATDAPRLESCQSLLDCVRTRLVAEELKTSARISIERPIAPNGAEWRITERGATLQTIADLLSEANAVFETALGECPAPRLVGPTGRWRPRFSHSPA